LQTDFNAVNYIASEKQIQYHKQPVYMIKTKVALWRAGFYPANQNNLKSFQKSLIGWKKAGPSKKPVLF